ncbi:GIY-YIG nuclease superfamily protein [Posidoniimonas polymericola]|uniref:GIY-YIG nuclease superfamily protein n=1 Tax=Posidoniimonas polymericola TaxID=2528002 RepID=A0A5C5XVV7_9BACT|nr:GIY-YIG nuclease family protein [Posidoniimonas polymericola]TWT67040.1 GIY-YIG nuclease superfamily protein [Posidoniimonas polymericola]
MTRLPRYWTYLLLSDRGETYAGYTSDLRRRLREHNSAENRGWTRGRRWRLAAAECYFDRASAVWVEKRLKRSRSFRQSWLRRSSFRRAWLSSANAHRSPLSRPKQ